LKLEAGNRSNAHGQTRKQPVKAWIPGCSSGEEAYSVTMVIMECVQESGRRYEFQVFGTDLDAEAIATGRAGLYPASVAKISARSDWSGSQQG